MKKHFIKYSAAGIIFVMIFNAFIQYPESNLNEKENYAAVSDTVWLWNGKNLDGLQLVLKTKIVLSENSYIVKDGTLHFFGNQNGYFRTKEIYSNYKLHVEWRWPDLNENGNSGILVHTQAPDSVWPKCIQVQFKKDNAGDFIGMNGATLKETIGKPKETAPKINLSNEKPEQEWNSCDVACSVDSIIVYVNGLLQNKGTKCNYTSGTIGFQLEGKPIEFRKIFLIKNE